MDLPRAAPAGYPAPLPRPAGRQNILNTRTPGKQIMGRVQHVGSYYAASSQRAPERPALADGVDCDVCVVGAGIAGGSTAVHLHAAIKERHERELHAEVRELRERYGYTSVRYVPREELRAILATERYRGALYDPNSGHLHPLNYTLGLAAAAEGLGVRIFEGTRATGFAPAGASQVHIRTPQGEVRARYLALCGNVYLGATAPTLASKIMAVATY